jgi:hypothetical protein
MLSGTYPESTSLNPIAAESVNFSRSFGRSGRPFRGRGNGRGFQRGNGNRNNWNVNSSFDYRSNSVNHSGGRGRFSHHQRGSRSGKHNWHRESNNYFGPQPQSFHQQIVRRVKNQENVLEWKVAMLLLRSLRSVCYFPKTTLL